MHPSPSGVRSVSTDMVTAIGELRLGPAAALFEGGEKAPLSFFVTEFRRGQGPPLHTHPYAEVFLVEAGAGEFTIGDETLIVRGEAVLVVSPGTPHRFTGASEEILRVVSMHPSPRVVQAATNTSL